MSPEKQSESSDAEQIEQQLSGLGDSRFARTKQEMKAAHETASGQVVGKLLGKVDELTKGKSSGRQPTATASSESADPQVAAAAAPILARLSNVEKILEEIGIAGRQSEAETRQAIETLLADVSKQEAGINSIVQFLRKQSQAQAPARKPSESDRPRSRLIPERNPAGAAVAVPVAPVAVAAVPVALEKPAAASGVAWHQAVFGPQLAADAETAPSRQQLLDAVTAGKKDAATLTGLLLMFQAATPDRRPQMLKDIGEAYCRWRPDADSDPDGMRAALVDWITEKSEESGKANTIELVHPGDRFDNTRHHAQERGAEIVRVFGWVVLRESGKVYTKASVAVK